MAHALIFDSGVGGLSVVAEIRRRLPGLRLTYAADDDFRPYGDKTEAQLRARLPALLSVLVETTRPDIVIIACNTASTTALADIRAALECPVIGVVPAIKPAAQATKTQTIAVLGTPGTIERRYVDDLISDFAKDCQVVLQGSVNLVEMAEAKLSGGTIDIDHVRQELGPLFTGRTGADIDVVVLACTHFPLLGDELKAAVRQSVKWIDSGAAIARRVEDILLDMQLLPTSSGRAILEASSEILPVEAPVADMALLVGPSPNAARRATFQSYGFSKVIGLHAAD